MSDPNLPGRLIVYGHNNCGQSVQLQQELDRKHVPYEWRDINKGDPSWREELRALAHGYLSVPTVVLPDGSVLVEPWPKEVLSRLAVPAGSEAPPDRPKPGLFERLWKRG